MARKPATPKLEFPAKDIETALAVKDGLREARFNLRRGARKLVDAIESATVSRRDERPDTAFGLLSEPLNAAVRTTAAILSNVDHAVVDLIGAGGPYRAMAVPPVRSASYFTPAVAACDLRLFTTDHKWRYRHWLDMIGRTEVFVHERAIELAGERVAEEALATPAADAATTASVIQALMAEDEVLTQSTLLGDDTDADLSALASLGAVVVVLAGEIEARLPGLDLRAQYLRVLSIADEVARAERDAWEHALKSPRPGKSMQDWLAFVTRYV